MEVPDQGSPPWGAPPRNFDVSFFFFFHFPLFLAYALLTCGLCFFFCGAWLHFFLGLSQPFDFRNPLFLRLSLFFSCFFHFFFFFAGTLHSLFMLRQSNLWSLFLLFGVLGPASVVPSIWTPTSFFSPPVSTPPPPRSVQLEDLVSGTCLFSRPLPFSKTLVRRSFPSHPSFESFLGFP